MTLATVRGCDKRLTPVSKGVECVLGDGEGSRRRRQGLNGSSKSTNRIYEENRAGGAA